MTPKEPHSSWTKLLVLRLLMERLSLRGIEREVQVGRATILRWLESWVKRLPRMPSGIALR